MLTYTADNLLALRHSRPPARPVRKAIFSAHQWQPQLARQSRDRLFVNKRSADCDRRLRIGWLNVRSLANKTTAVQEIIAEKDLDILALTETGITTVGTSHCVKLRRLITLSSTPYGNRSQDTVALLSCTVVYCGLGRSTCH